MTPAVGIMQGRLLPPFEGRFQAFPATGWAEEFVHAKEAGLACIEWIYERPHETDNPLGSGQGVAAMQRLANETGVAVRSICADYYMTEHLVNEDATANAGNIAHLREFLGRAATLGVTYIVLPFVDFSSLKTPQHLAAAARVLRGLVPEAAAAKVELHIECDLPPDRFRGVLDEIGSPWIKANFDMGNSASLGFDPTKELAALAPHLGSVHVKDRLLSGGTVPLGQGNADFQAVFRGLRKAGFSRWLVLQVARAHRSGAEVTPVELARENREFVERCWADA
jgi:hexulose-6-phosphate isomerase